MKKATYITNRRTWHIICVATVWMLLTCYPCAGQNTPDIRVIDGERVKSEQVYSIYSKFLKQDSGSSSAVKDIKKNTSTWFLIPGSLVKKQKGKNYLLTGYQDYVDLYRIDQGSITKMLRGGKFINKDQLNDSVSRYAVRLYGDEHEIADAYLVAVRRYGNINYTKLQMTFADKTDMLSWQVHYLAAVKKFSNVYMLMLGALLTTFTFVLTRYFLNKETGYIFFSLYIAMNFLFYLLLFFQVPANIDLFPFNSPKAGLVLLPVFPILALTAFFISFKQLNKNRYLGVNISGIADRLTAISAVSSLLIICINFFYEEYYIGNQLSIATIILLNTIIYFYFFKHLKGLKAHMTYSARLIISGGIIWTCSTLVGIILSVTYKHTTGNYSNEVYLFSPILIGLTLSNIIILIAFNYRDNKILKENNKLKIKYYEDELHAIQNSLNPHFIFNSLNQIEGFLFQNQLQTARSVLFNFSNLLKLVVNRTTDRFISLKEELEITRLYLSLEQQRRKDRFKYHITIPEGTDIEKISVPTLMLQPLVENAIKHGILNNPHTEGILSISAGIEQDFLILKVEDNGPGPGKSMTADISGKRRKHWGIELTRRRLDLISKKWKKEASLTLEASNTFNTGTLAIIKMPVLLISDDQSIHNR